jgi:PAS domain S-box-containing protein
LTTPENRGKQGESWEEAALDEDWLCRQIVMEAGDAIIFADRVNVIRLRNRGAERIFGYTGEEALGQSLNLIIPERWRERHWESYRRVMATGATKYGQGELLAVPGQRRNGEPLSLGFSLALIRDDDGRILGSAAILRDVTARWAREKEMKGRLADLEKKVRGPHQ